MLHYNKKKYTHITSFINFRNIAHSVFNNLIYYLTYWWIPKNIISSQCHVLHIFVITILSHEYIILETRALFLSKTSIIVYTCVLIHGNENKIFNKKCNFLKYKLSQILKFKKNVKNINIFSHKLSQFEIFCLNNIAYL